MKGITIRFLTTVCVVLMLAVEVCSRSFGASVVEDALLKGNWKEVCETLEKDSSRAEDPVARLIMAHGCLASNRNNASMLLLLSAQEGGDLKEWCAWTESFLLRNPRNPVALYLSGDAKARIGKLDEAVNAFTQALQAKEDFALAYNARGVVHVLNNEWDRAWVDFSLATKLAPDFADGYVGLGTLGVLRETSLDLDTGTLDAFNQAISINPEFALAYNGRGCIYFGSARFEQAVEDFSIASQLSPVLVIAEVNRGFASAYASKLVALGSTERKPGTTLESIHQQYPNILREQRQRILNMLPSRQDQEFWKKMDALPWILSSDEKTQALVKEHGLQKVQMGAFLKMQELRNQLAESNTEVQTLYKAVGSYDRTIWNLRQAELWTSLGFAAVGTAKDIQGIKDVKSGWDAFARAEWRAGKQYASSLVQDRTGELAASAIPTTMDPLSYSLSVASQFGLKTARYIAEDKQYASRLKFENLCSDMQLRGAWLRAIETNLHRLGATEAVRPTIESSRQVPGFYTSTDRPLTEIGALASMVDKTIKSPVDRSARRALVVGQDAFRANLQQQELHRYGFETKLVSPRVDVQTEARRWGADVILGIRGTTEPSKTTSAIKAPRIGLIPLDDPSQRFYDDIRRKLPPPFPPDKGGGAAGIAPQNWDWGRSFIPTPPRGAPGGISTEELARSFVDKGNWPVLTAFGLFYGGGRLMEGQNDKGASQ